MELLRSAGRAAYEAECERWPFTSEGFVRPTWEEISQEARDSWEKNHSYRRAYPPFGISPYYQRRENGERYDIRDR
jgi:hypothetical protein